jgi:hypothetical protein
MKPYKALNTLLLVLVIITAPLVSSAQDNDRKLVKFKQFQTGEQLSYTCYVGLLTAGKGTVTVDRQLYKLSDKICYRVDVEGKTSGMFALGMKVNDLWRSFVDTSLMVPWKFHRNLKENNYRLEETTYFDHNIKKARVDANHKGKKKGGIYEIPQYSQDMISGYLYLRTLDFDNMQPGHIISVNSFLENKVYDFKIKYLGKKVLKTKFGKIDTYVLTPIMPDNGLFLSGENAIKFWVSADDNRIPLKINANMLWGIGLVEINLTEHKGLKQPLKTTKKRRR